MTNKIYNIPKTLQKLGIKKNSKNIKDYETAKRWIYYKPIDEYEYMEYLKEIAKYIGI